MDIQSPRILWLKFWLFVAIAIASAALLLLQHPAWSNAALLAVAMWGSCRAYYFLFYVLEKYVDPTRRYSGIIDLLRGLNRNRRKR